MSDDKRLPQDAETEIQDFQLVQVLHQSRELAAARADDDAASGWRELDGRLGRILARLGTDGGEPAREPDEGIARIDRSSFTLDVDTTDRVAGSLMALADRPDVDQLELANRAVRDLEDLLR